MRTKRANRGFTLVEILIVVVILGILAAIVIPQFTQASTEAKISSLQSNLQSIRSQIELYKIQHNDEPPSSAANFVTQMTTQTDVNGNPGFDFGPYLQKMPLNPFSGVNPPVILAEPTNADWYYINLGVGTGQYTFDVGTGSDGSSSADYIGVY
jgi:general secretion pathway protein G